MHQHRLRFYFHDDKRHGYTVDVPGQTPADCVTRALQSVNVAAATGYVLEAHLLTFPAWVLVDHEMPESEAQRLDAVRNEVVA